ncbi:MAG: NAD-dependent epimerase/dehydratase family protein [Saprospiraceae bacterium]|nr:NAD-dependent epimerase/dehydratase family protein [Saprospiraceae bacterium]
MASPIHPTQHANHANHPTTQVALWGTGAPLREFMHVDDLANASYFLMNHYSEEQFVNVGSGEEVSIKDLASLIKEIVGFKGELLFGISKPDGTPRKLMDSSKLNRLGYKSLISLKAGIERVYKEYQQTSN